MRKLFSFGLLLLLPGLVLAQHRPKPKAKKKPRTAVTAKTAAPAKAAAPYFQQEVSYAIDVKLDDRAHYLRGHEELTYRNNSPQTLGFIWFHLWPNGYRDNTTAFVRQKLRDGSNKFYFAPAKDKGFIDSLNFVVNGQPATLEPDPANPDIAKLVLPQKLAPGASVTIATPFRVKVPESFSRLGHEGQSYQISQWYPKPAVLDRRGWHPIPYLDQGEFYSEFGSFDVTITLPTNYTVGATGVLQNPDEEARMAALAAQDAGKKTAEEFGGVKAAKGQSADLLTAAKAKAMAFPPSESTYKTLRYKQDRVHDFAWFADKRFHVLQDSTALPSGRKVLARVLFTNKEPQKWVKGLQDVKDALFYYSKWVGEYPYASATAVDGALVAGGGMEYPMVTVTQPGAIVHEVGHNWFYGILGSNERDFPWMDEGVNTYTEGRVSALDTVNITGMSAIGKSPRISRAFGLQGLPASAYDQLPYQALASRNLDQPAQGPTSNDYTMINYGLVVYQKTASLLKYLAGYLGQEKFDAAMRSYYERWKFRHPYPEDMQAAFEASTGQRLGWFFQGMMQNTDRYDADLRALAVYSDTVKVLVRTTATTPWAVPVSTVDKEGKILQTLWTKPFGNTDDEAELEAESQLNFRRAGVAALVVDAAYVTPQLNRRNDRLTLADHPSRREPLGLRPLLSVERWERAFVNFVPVAGANTSDKFMLGAAFYNNPLNVKRVQFLAMPMYSFVRNELNGIGTIQLNLLPATAAQRAELGFSIQRFERYIKYEPRLVLTLPHRVGYPVQQHLTLANTIVTNEDVADKANNTGVFQAIEYQADYHTALQRWSADVELNRLLANNADDASERQAVLLRASATYSRNYAPKKKVQVRLFGGRFLQQPSNSPFYLGLSGSPDYRRQTFFLDRQQISPTFAAQTHQTDGRDGAFGTYLPVFEQKWLASLNLQADLPVTPLGVFADFGASDGRFDMGHGPQRLYYDAGLKVPVLRDVLRFYLPIAGSQYANGFPGSRQDFTDRIRFELRLNKLNPFRLLDEQLER